MAETSDIVEDVKDIVSDSGELVEDTVEFVRESWTKNNPNAIACLVGATGLALGLTAGYLIANKILKKKYEQIARDEIEDVKNNYVIPALAKGGVDNLAEMASSYEGEPETDKSAAETIIRRSGYLPYDKIQPSEEAKEAPPAKPTVIENHNIFKDAEAEKAGRWDPDRESTRRIESPETPYVITESEYDEGDEEYEQVAMTYYDGDGVLTDSMDQRVDEVDETVGVENLLRFGDAAHDPNIVHIRNNRLTMDIELTRHPGNYAEEVLDFRDNELRHSDSRRPRRRRLED